MKEYIKGLKKGLPIGLGYISVSFVFGLVAVKMGFLPITATLIAATNLASAGQMAGISWIDESGILHGAALPLGHLLELVVVTLVVNIRYSLMALSLTQKIAPNTPWWKRMIMAGGVADEIFALASLEKGEIAFEFFVGLMTLPILGWSLGTLMGSYASDILPLTLQGCMGLALYCMFIAVIIPPAKKGRKVRVCIITAITISCMFRYLPLFSIIRNLGGGWSMVISAVMAAAVCATIKELKRRRAAKGLGYHRFLP